MKDKPIGGSGEGKKPERTVTSCKIDKEFELKLVQFLRGSIAPMPTEALAAHFSKPLQYVEHYLDRLSEQKFARYVRIGGQWGWIAVPLDSN